MKADSFELLYLSSAAEKIYGRPISEFLDNPQLWLQVMHPDDREKISNFSERILETGSQAVEYRIVRPDGSIRWLLDRGWLVSGSDGGVLRLDGLASDITERKQNEEKLLQQADLLNLAHDAIMVRDIEGTICFWNQGAAAMYGWSVPEAIGKNSHQLLQTQFPQKQEEIMADILHKGHWEGELTHIRRDGTIVIVLCRWSLQLDEADHPTRILEINHDITERQRAQQNVQEHAALLDVATDAILVKGKDNRIKYWNQGATTLYGWTLGDALEQDVDQLLLTNEVENRVIEQCLREQGKWQGEQQHVTKSGEAITVISRWTLVKDSQGNPKTILMVNTDVTQAKKLEQQFLRAQRLESIGSLASGIAHDLNNILTPIYGVAQLLPLQLPNAGEQIQHQFEILQTCAQRGSKLITQVLSFSRGADGERAILYIKPLLSELRDFIHKTFPKSIEISMNIAEDLWPIHADATQVHQVFMNLLVNARDAMPEGGSLSVHAMNLTLDEALAADYLNAQAGPYILVTVTDTGVGIPPELQEQIFEPFFTTKEPEGGTGLGLSTVNKIIQSHHGFITVYSEVGQGTQFKIYLPAVESAESVEEEQLECPNGHEEVVLVVDDEAPIREVAQSMLLKHNYRVMVAADGIDAIAQYAQHHTEIDVVLMDMQMPTLSGETTIQTLRKINPQLKVIVTSGLLVDEPFALSLGQCVKAFLQKPFSSDTLLRVLQNILQEKSQDTETEASANKSD